MQSSLGRSLYRRILRELKATRNYDHHLRDIRFLLWVPGTQGKRKFDALKQLAERSQSLHPRRAKKQQSVVVASPEPKESLTKTSLAAEEQQQPQQDSTTPVVVKNPNPTIADQIRAVARELFNQNAKAIAAQQQQQQQEQLAVQKARMLQEGTARAFWAIKRLQDVRSGTVPTASLWLTGQHLNNPNAFDPFGPRETQLRSGAFPFLPEFLGIGEAEEAGNREAIDAAVERLNTSSRCTSKALRLEVVARCAVRDGQFARYHISFRVENISPDAAVDIKLAHLFAVRCESPPVLTEMVCLLPLLANSILRPAAPLLGPDGTPIPREHYSFVDDSNNADGEQDGDDDDDHDEENNEDAKNSNGGQQQTQTQQQQPQQQQEDQTSSAGKGTTASLPPSSAAGKSGSSGGIAVDTFTAKANPPEHCAVYDVVLPVQGECILRGVVFYRVISNNTSAVAAAAAVPPPPSMGVMLGGVEDSANSNGAAAGAADSSAQAADKSGAAGGGDVAAGAAKASSMPPPTSVKSRLKALHFPPIRLTANDE